MLRSFSKRRLRWRTSGTLSSAKGLPMPSRSAAVSILRMYYQIEYIILILIKINGRSIGALV